MARSGPTSCTPTSRRPGRSAGSRRSSTAGRRSRRSAGVRRPCRIVHTYHGHTFHGYFGPLRSRLYLAIERALARTTDRIVVISEEQRREILERYGVGRPGQFRVVPLGIDLSGPAAQPGALRRALGVGADEPLVGIVGRLCRVKNHAMLLDAAARVPGCRWVIVGDGELRGALEAHAQALGLGDRVHFAGLRRDVLALYGDLDLAVLTSVNEGTPVTLIEAMSRGRASRRPRSAACPT